MVLLLMLKLDHPTPSTEQSTALLSHQVKRSLHGPWLYPFWKPESNSKNTPCVVVTVVRERRI